MSVVTVQCPRCSVCVPADKLDAKDRCLDPRCPLKRKES
jgi:hypothetical protein